MDQHIFNMLCILAQINTNRRKLVMSLIYAMKLAVEIYWRIRGRLTKQPLPRSSAALRTSSWADKLRRMASCRELLLIWSLLRSFHFHPLTDDSQPAAGFFQGWIMVWRSYRSSLTSRQAHTRRHFQNIHLLCDSFMHKNNRLINQTEQLRKVIPRNLNGIFPYASTRTGVDDIIRQSPLNSNSASCHSPLSCRGRSSQGSPIFPRGDWPLLKVTTQHVETY